MAKRWYSMRASEVGGRKVAEIRIYDEIGFWGTTAKVFVTELEALAADADSILVAINSPGGDVSDAFAIYNALRRMNKRVVTRVDSVAASAASLVLMAGDEIVMPENAQIMIHHAWTIAAGNADELRATADWMDKWGDSIVAAYVSRSGQSDEDVRSMMAATTWMTAREAQALGFCDSIEEPVKLMASATAKALLARHVALPDGLLAAIVESDSDGELAPSPELTPAPPEPAPAPEPAPTDPPQATALARRVSNLCREKNIAHLSTAVMLSGGLDSEEAATSRVEAAAQIAGLCLAAKLPDCAIDFVNARLNVEQVRARLFDQVVKASADHLSNLQRPPTPPATNRALNAQSIYAARRAHVATSN